MSHSTTIYASIHPPQSNIKITYGIYYQVKRSTDLCNAINFSILCYLEL